MKTISFWQWLIYRKRQLHFSTLSSQRPKRANCTSNFSYNLLRNIINTIIHNYPQKVGQKILNNTYNCGLYIIHFLRCIVNNDPLTKSQNMIHCRKEIKENLLSKSDSIKGLCVFCLRAVQEESQFQCRFCQRCIHSKCLLTVNEIKNGVIPQKRMTNNMCDLCRQY